MKTVRIPDFFLVGAPKCGTTSLHTYLSQHPQIFMARMRGSNHFAADLLRRDDRWRDRKRYLRLFRTVREKKRIGEASVYYMLSRKAAEEIHRFSPRAAILIMVRNPIDVIPSYHAQMVYDGNEPLQDLEAALDAEEARRRGDRLPVHIRFPQKLFYREIATFSDAIARYRQEFGRQQVRVIVYDEFSRNTTTCYRDTLRFLSVDDRFKPEFPVVNPHKRVRSEMLCRVLSGVHLNSPRARRLVPVSVRLAGRRFLRTLQMRVNTRHVPRPQLAPHLRTRLEHECAEEIGRLSALLNRDLSEWLRGTQRGAPWP
ncbi:MAG: sulfotransferase [Lentisphaerae bacterium]|nr:sulfotransferase [Lentisphaerota bacterium]